MLLEKFAFAECIWNVMLSDSQKEIKIKNVNSYLKIERDQHHNSGSMPHLQKYMQSAVKLIT